mgnify:CR=1 FL=1
MKRITVSLALLAFAASMGASGANAQGRHDPNGLRAAVASKVEILQKGRHNGAAVAQKGPANAAGISQNGVSNTGQINQTGASNDASIKQIGRGNDASITQTGANNSARVVQIGKNLSTDVVQEGNNQNYGVVQTKQGAYNVPAGMCSLDPAGKGYLRQLSFGRRF